MGRLPDEIDDATLRLLCARGIGPATVRKLRSHLGSDRAVVAATERELTAVGAMGPPTVHALRRAMDEADPAAERAAMTAAGVHLVLRGDSDYPSLLSTIADPPEALRVRGVLRPSDRLAVAIVGTRRPTAYGREQAGRLASLLADAGLVVVSGGALGIDAEAHRGALRVGGRTIAVLGSGLARLHPRRHAPLFDRIAGAGGALVSEHPMRVPPRPGHFPRRNRIVSGLSLGVLVIEAAARSGALITARLAAEDHGREVMALPGRADSPASAGCHRLLRDGAAALVTSHAEVLAQLDACRCDVRLALERAGHAGATTAASLFHETLSTGQRIVLEHLADARSSVPLDTLAMRTGRPLPDLLADLTLLEIRGRVSRDGAGFRARDPPPASAARPSR